MFQTLIASGPPARPRLAQYLLSFGVHSLTILAALALTRHPPTAARLRPLVTNLVFAPPRPSPMSVQEHPVSLEPAPSLVAGRPVLDIPHVSSSALPATVPDIADMIGEAAGRSGLQPNGSVSPSDTGLQSAMSVDDPVSVVDQPAPRYPPVLAQAGVAGQVELEYVVDTLGHVEPGSVRVLVSTYPEFETGARAAVLASRFRPARLRGHPVRQRVRQRFTFRLDGSDRGE
jgi:TonB family protein